MVVEGSVRSLGCWYDMLLLPVSQRNEWRIWRKMLKWFCCSYPSCQQNCGFNDSDDVNIQRSMEHSREKYALSSWILKLVRTKMSNECTAQEESQEWKKIKKKMKKEATWDGEALILLNCRLQVWTTKLHSKESGHLAKWSPRKDGENKACFLLPVYSRMEINDKLKKHIVNE